MLSVSLPSLCSSASTCSTRCTQCPLTTLSVRCTTSITNTMKQEQINMLSVKAMVRTSGQLCSEIIQRIMKPSSSTTFIPHSKSLTQPYFKGWISSLCTSKITLKLRKRILLSTSDTQRLKKILLSTSDSHPLTKSLTQFLYLNNFINLK